MGYIQSVRFNRKYWSEAKAMNWLYLHKFIPIKKVDKTKNYFRYRMHEPIFNHYITKKLDNNIELVIGFL